MSMKAMRKKTIRKKAMMEKTKRMKTIKKKTMSIIMRRITLLVKGLLQSHSFMWSQIPWPGKALCIIGPLPNMLCLEMQKLSSAQI